MDCDKKKEAQEEMWHKNPTISAAGTKEQPHQNEKESTALDDGHLPAGLWADFEERLNEQTGCF